MEGVGVVEVGISTIQRMVNLLDNDALNGVQNPVSAPGGVVVQGGSSATLLRFPVDVGCCV